MYYWHIWFWFIIWDYDWKSNAFHGLVGGAIVGIFIGAIKGQTTETGFLNGAGIGALTGAIAAIQLLEPAADGESLSKVLMLYAQYNFHYDM